MHVKCKTKKKLIVMALFCRLLVQKKGLNEFNNHSNCFSSACAWLCYFSCLWCTKGLFRIPNVWMCISLREVYLVDCRGTEANATQSSQLSDYGVLEQYLGFRVGDSSGISQSEFNEFSCRCSLLLGFCQVSSVLFGSQVMFSNFYTVHLLPLKHGSWLSL